VFWIVLRVVEELCDFVSLFYFHLSELCCICFLYVILCLFWRLPSGEALVKKSYICRLTDEYKDYIYRWVNEYKGHALAVGAAPRAHASDLGPRSVPHIFVSDVTPMNSLIYSSVLRHLRIYLKFVGINEYIELHSSTIYSMINRWIYGIFVSLVDSNRQMNQRFL
jgi:hypothetical protein